MGYQVFPTPTAASLPPGATSLVFSGVARQGGFTYTSTSLSAGSKLVYANAGSGKTFVVFGSANNKASLLQSGSYGVVTFSTTETRTTVTDVASFSPTRFSFSTAVGQKTLFTTAAGYLFTITGSISYIGVTTNYTTWSTRATFSTQAGSSTDRNCQLAFGNGVYVAQHGGTNTGTPMLFSTDGINWVSRARVNTDSDAGLGFNGNRFIIRENNQVFISTDGLNWTSNASPSTPYGSLGMFTENGYFLLPSGVNATYRTVMTYSTNGTTWATSTIPGPSSTTGYYSSITYGNGIFVAAGTDSSLFPIAAVSTNLTTWSFVRTNGTTSSGLGYIQYSNGVFYAMWSGDAQANGKYISIDGVNWTTIPAIRGSYSIKFQSDGNKTLAFIDGSGTDDTGSATDGFTVTADGSTPYIELYNMSATNLN